MTTSPLTRDIGQAERGLRALLDRQLRRAGLSFPEWTVLAFLAEATALTRIELVQRQVSGQVAAPQEAGAAVDGLVARGLIAGSTDDSPLSVTPAGSALVAPVRSAVVALTEHLHADLPPADVAATRRTLNTLAERADTLLGAESAATP